MTRRNYSILFQPTEFHCIGPFRFPIYKALLPGEMKYLESISRDDANVKFASVRLAKKIAADKGIDIDAAFELLTSLQDAGNKSLVFEYLEDIENLNTGSRGETLIKSDLVTIVMKFRGQVKFPEDETYTPMKDWSDADTDNLPPHIMDEIFQLAIWERDGWPEPGKTQPEEKSPPSPTTTKS